MRDTCVHMCMCACIYLYMYMFCLDVSVFLQEMYNAELFGNSLAG